MDTLLWGSSYTDAFVIAIITLMAIGAGVQWDFRTRREETATAHGSARWATQRDLRRAGLLGQNGLILGRWPGFVSSSLLRIVTDRHLLTIAPSRSGKGVGAIIPNLLTYPGSVFVIDPKGENARAAARQRAAFGQTIHVPQPLGVTGIASAAFNPLDQLDAGSPDLAEDAALIADALVTTKQGAGMDAFWEAEAKALIAGLVLYIVTCEPRTLRTLPRVRQLLTLDAAAFEALLGVMAASAAAGGLVARCANRMRQKPDRERASVLSSAQSHTHFLDSPRMAAVLSHSDFDAADLKRQPMSIFLVLPSVRLHSHARWLRLMVNLTLAALADRPERPPLPVLFLLDEFAALGRLEMIETAIGLMAGYGVQLWPIVQDISQLRDLYPDRWPSFLANAGAVQTFGVNDPVTAEIVSTMLGTRTVTVQSNSRGHNARGSSGGVNYSVVARPLLHLSEICNLPRNDELLFVDGLPPIRARKIAYYRERAFDAAIQPGRTLRAIRIKGRLR